MHAFAASYQCPDTAATVAVADYRCLHSLLRFCLIRLSLSLQPRIKNAVRSNNRLKVSNMHHNTVLLSLLCVAALLLASFATIPTVAAAIASAAVADAEVTEGPQPHVSVDTSAPSQRNHRHYDDTDDDDELLHDASSFHTESDAAAAPSHTLSAHDQQQLLHSIYSPHTTTTHTSTLDAIVIWILQHPTDFFIGCTVVLLPIVLLASCSALMLIRQLNQEERERSSSSKHTVDISDAAAKERLKARIQQAKQAAAAEAKAEADVKTGANVADKQPATVVTTRQRKQTKR